MGNLHPITKAEYGKPTKESCVEMIFKYGKINKDELVNIPTPFVINDHFLTEDLFQLDFENGRYGLDVGWYCYIYY